VDGWYRYSALSHPLSLSRRGSRAVMSDNSKKRCALSGVAKMADR
jgi:hypothetical protein